jgi:hypothetical protein
MSWLRKRTIPVPIKYAIQYLEYAQCGQVNLHTTETFNIVVIKCPDRVLQARHGNNNHPETMITNTHQHTENQ